MFRRETAVLLWGAAVLAGGCQNSQKAARDDTVVSTETRRTERIPDHSTPEAARAAMGRAPDAIQKEGADEVHYYLIRGAASGEALRLVYRDGRLIGRSVVTTRSGE